MDLLGHNVDVLGYILFIIHLFFIYSTLKCKKDERKKSTGRRSKISERQGWGMKTSVCLSCDRTLQNGTGSAGHYSNLNQSRPRRTV